MKSIIFVFIFAGLLFTTSFDLEKSQNKKYPFWSRYNKTPISQIKLANWIAKDRVKNGWEKLFNGKNLDGWKVKCQAKDKEKNFWSAVNGQIQCNSLGSKDHGYIWLISEKEYSDFELRLKFKVSRNHIGNTGIQIRSRYDNTAEVENGEMGWLDGPQVDIDPNNPWRNGLIYDETRTEKRWINPSLTDWRVEKEKHAPEKVIFYWEDQKSGWNDITIIAKGTTIKTIVNNVLVSDYDGNGILNNEGHVKYKVGLNGHIAIQLHKKSENLIWFKDIEVRDLSKQ